MRRLASSLARAGLAGTLLGIGLAVSRFGPVHAEPPLDVRALPLVPWALGFAVLAALTAGERPRRRLGRLWLALAATASALAGVVWLRGPSGLPAEVWVEERIVERLPPGAVELVPGEGTAPAGAARWALRWEGALRAPQSGSYRLWVEGRGRVGVWLDGRRVLEAEGERLDAAAALSIGRGTHRLEVRQQRERRDELRMERIRGQRLSLGWTRPRRNGAPGGRSEVVPPRYLGPSGSPALWALTDALSFACAGLLAAGVLLAPWDRPVPLPAPRAPSRWDWLPSALGLGLIVAAMSWPLPLDPARLGVAGRADGDLNLWILAWGAHALPRQPLRVFDAPIFHPARDALAFSENLLLPSALGAPFTLAGGPVLGYNAVFWLSAVVSGLGVDRLVRRASGDRRAAFVAGALFAAGIHRFTRIAHLQAQLTLFVPFALLALDRFLERPVLRRALLVGVLLAAQGLSSVYLGAITATLLAAAAALAVLAGLRGRPLLRLVAGFACAAVLLLPAALPYLRVRAAQGSEFSLEEAEAHKATLESYLASGSWLYSGLTRRQLDPERHRRPLFPGLVPLALGLAGLASAPRRYRAVALMASVVGILLSLGPETAVYRALHQQVVLFRGLRALSRYSLLPVLALCVSSGFALARRRRLALVALALALVEARPAALEYGAWSGPSDASRWLAGETGAVFYAPLGERDPELLLESTAHLRPMLNGYSGVTPRHYSWLAEAVDVADSEESLRFLRAVGVRQVVARQALALPEARRFGEDRVYRVPPGESVREVAAAPAQPTLWDAEGAVVDLGTSREVGRVAFIPDGDPPARPPQVSLSLDGRRWRELPGTLSFGATALSLALEPKHGLAELRFPPAPARFLRIRGLPARRGALMVETAAERPDRERAR